MPVVLPAVIAGWHPPSTGRFDSVSHTALEDGSAADSGALAYALHHGLLAAVPGKWRCVPGRAHGPFRNHSVASGDCFLVDGSGGFAAARRAATRTPGCGRGSVGVWASVSF